MENLNNNVGNIDPDDGRAGKVVREEVANFLETYVRTWEKMHSDLHYNRKIGTKTTRYTLSNFLLYTIEKTVSRNLNHF